MQRIFLLALPLLFCWNISRSQLVDVIVEEVAQLYLSAEDPVLYSSYRISARLVDNIDRVMGVYSSGMWGGDSLHVLAIGTNALNTCPHALVNFSYGTVVDIPDNMISFCAIDPTICYESFVTLDGSTDVDPGDLDLFDINSLEASFGNCPGALFCQPLYSDSAGWSVSLNEEEIFDQGNGGFPVGPDNRVLLFQVLCPTGQLRFAINLWVVDTFGSGPMFYCHNKNQGPGQIGNSTEIDFTDHGLVYPLEGDNCIGCSDPLACNYLEWSTSAETCAYAENCEDVEGCMDPVACNYNPLAIFDFVNSCVFAGCLDVNACNYDPSAGCDDGSCLYAGCMDPAACNYDSLAPCPDNSCVFPGCTSASACNYNPEAGCDDGSCCFATDCLNESGCMDPLACNFNPNAICSLPETCIESGCTDVGACNYNIDAQCDDGSCFYSGITGYVFLDSDANGNWNQLFFNESGVWNVEVILWPEGISVFTDENGFFAFPEVEGNEHSLEIIPDAINWTMTTNPQILTNPNECIESHIGITADDYSFAVSGPCCIWMMDIHCSNGFNPGVFINNLGTLPLHGTCTITCDPLFTFSSMNSESVTDPDFISDGIITWNITDQAPFSSEIYQVHVNGPGAEYTGQTFVFIISVQLQDEEGNTFFNASWELNPTVLCSYDPNDKYTAEPGYTEEHHFISKNDEMEYRIRFQNTGNYPAENIVIRDTLDISFLDLETFEPLFASHNFSTQLEDNGAIAFTFPNIMLPDSGSNEPGSQGYVVYKISPRADVNHMDVIHNKAYIFFDENPPILTNETWHTIMDCDSLAGPIGPESCCVGDTCVFLSPEDFVESYTWNIDNIFVADSSHLEYTFSQSGFPEIELVTINPICNNTYHLDFAVNALPETQIEISNLELTAPDGTSWQWYHEGILIPGATNQIYIPSWDNYQEGYFNVWVTNEFGCSQWSEEVFFLHDIESKVDQIQLYPNPASESCTLNVPNQYIGQELHIVDISGKTVYSVQIAKSVMKIDTSVFTSGTYTLVIPESDAEERRLIVRR